jgi:hypothetical protein
VIAGCGRIDFDERSPADAAPADAVPACTASQLGAPLTVTAASFPTATAAGDLDRDGKLDLVVQHGQSVSVLRGHGDGTFEAGVAYAAADGSCPQGSESVAIADLDRDGNPDVVTSDCTTVSSATNGGLIVLLGNGDGTLRPWVRYQVGQAVNAVAIADLDGDGILDLVGTTYYGGSAVGVLLGNGDGTFRTHVDYNVDAFPSYVAIVDVDRDGKLDLAVANESGLGASVLLGNGDGTFRPQVEYATGSLPEALAVADVNGDGRLDLLVANDGDVASNGISVLLGNGDGTFTAGAALTDNLPWSVAVRVNSPLDIIVANSTSPGAVTVFTGTGPGTFAPGVDVAVGDLPTSVITADVDGNGIDDVVVTSQNAGTLSVLLATCTAH